MNNNPNPLKKYPPPADHTSNSYNTNSSGNFWSNSFSNSGIGASGNDRLNISNGYHEPSLAEIYGNRRVVDEDSNQKLLEDEIQEIKTEDQVPDIGNQFAPEGKPTTGLIGLKYSEDLIKEFFSTWPHSVNVQGIPTAPDDVKGIALRGAYNPAANSSLTFAAKNVKADISSKEPMNRAQINSAVKDKDKKTSEVGLSASKWTDSILEALRCVHYPNFHMEAIIPSFEQRQNKVLSLLQTYKMATFMYESIKQPEESDLKEYGTSTHITHFLLNPWLPVFLSLRDLVSIGNTATIKANTNASNSITLEDRADAERKLENMTEQLLHRFMEITLMLFSIICNERDQFRSTHTRTGGSLKVGSYTCEIDDDGYVYVARKDNVLATTRYGRTPVIRFEAKRMKSGNKSAVPQIFSELLSAAALNRQYDIAKRGLEASDYHDVRDMLNHFFLSTNRFVSRLSSFSWSIIQ
uniref:WGS project CBMI000000000 data, contig CS3069_c002280 n=1 Tax=Fusarium clavum TaxID=2594811 RepID=A0A090N5P1_9HYPO|nr:unnamed protein product [Fusarium clavum]